MAKEVAVKPDERFVPLAECLQESLRKNNQCGLPNPKTRIDFPGISNEKVYDEEDFASSLPRSFCLPEGICWSHIPTARKLDYLRLQAEIDQREGYMKPFVDEAAFAPEENLFAEQEAAIEQANALVLAEMAKFPTKEEYYQSLLKTVQPENAGIESNDP